MRADAGPISRAWRLPRGTVTIIGVFVLVQIPSVPDTAEVLIVMAGVATHNRRHKLPVELPYFLCDIVSADQGELVW